MQKFIFVMLSLLFVASTRPVSEDERIADETNTAPTGALQAMD